MLIQLVIDTNIFVCAVLQPNGTPAKIFVSALAGDNVQLCITADIYWEYEEVTHRPKFKPSENEIVNALRAIRELGKAFPKTFESVPIPTMTCSWNARRLPMLSLL